MIRGWLLNSKSVGMPPTGMGCFLMFYKGKVCFGAGGICLSFSDTELGVLILD